MARIFECLANGIVRYRRWILLVFAILIGGGVFTSKNLQFAFSPQQFFQKDQGPGEYRAEFADTFIREDNLTILAVHGGPVFEPEILEVLRDLTLKLREQETIIRAESIATVPLPRRDAETGEIRVAPLLQQEEGASPGVRTEQAERLRELISTNELIQGRLVSPDHRTTAIMIWLKKGIQDIEAIREGLSGIQENMEAHPLPGPYSYKLGGIPPLRDEIIRTLRGEQYRFVPLMAVATIVILTVLFWRIGGVLLPLVVVLTALLFTFSVMVWTGSPIDVVNNVLPTLIFVIGISDSIHMITRHAEEHARGKGALAATRAMIRHTGMACLLTSTTTAIGFLSLINANTRLLQGFSWQAAAGVMFAYLATLFLLPSLLVYCKPVKREATGSNTEEEEGKKLLIERGLSWFGSFTLAYPRWIIAGSILFCAGAGYLASTVELNEFFLKIFQDNHPVQKKTEFMEAKFGGFLPVEVGIEAEEQGAFSKPENYRKLARVQRFAAGQPEVLSTRSMIDFHRTIYDLQTEGNGKSLPRSRNRILFLHTLLTRSSGKRTGPEQFVTGDFRHARILLRVRDVGAKKQLALGKRLKTKLKEVFGKQSDMTFRLTGDAYAVSRVLKTFIQDLMSSLLLAFLVIFGLIAVAFRSIKLGLISIIPNVIPLLAAFAFMGVTGINLNSRTVIIFAIGLGLAVDDTIHVLSRFQESFQRKRKVREAIQESYFGAGRAIMLTSLLLLVGMSVLLTSSFVPTREFAILVGIVILGAIFADLLLLPALLYLVYDDGKQQRELRDEPSCL